MERSEQWAAIAREARRLGFTAAEWGLVHDEDPPLTLTVFAAQLGGTRDKPCARALPEEASVGRFSWVEVYASAPGRDLPAFLLRPRRRLLSWGGVTFADATFSRRFQVFAAPHDAAQLWRLLSPGARDALYRLPQRPAWQLSGCELVGAGRAEPYPGLRASWRLGHRGAETLLAPMVAVGRAIFDPTA
jgi:hypothetical protein